MIFKKKYSVLIILLLTLFNVRYSYSKSVKGIIEFDTTYATIFFEGKTINKYFFNFFKDSVKTWHFGAEIVCKDSSIKIIKINNYTYNMKKGNKDFEFKEKKIIVYYNYPKYKIIKNYKKFNNELQVLVEKLLNDLYLNDKTYKKKIDDAVLRKKKLNLICYARD